MTTKKKASKKPVKKTTTKKVAKKAETKTEEISARQVGRNVMIVIEGKTYSRAFAEKSDREAILSKVEEFNKKNSKAKKAGIIKTMTEHLDTKTNKPKAAPPKKVSTKKPKVSKEVVQKSDLEKAKELLQKEGYNVSKNPPQVSRRRGEY